METPWEALIAAKLLLVYFQVIFPKNVGTVVLTGWKTPRKLTEEQVYEQKCKKAGDVCINKIQLPERAEMFGVPVLHTGGEGLTAVSAVLACTDNNLQTVGNTCSPAYY